MVQIEVPFIHHSIIFQTFMPHISNKDCVVVFGDISLPTHKMFIDLSSHRVMKGVQGK